MSKNSLLFLFLSLLSCGLLEARIEDLQNILNPDQKERLLNLQNELYNRQKVDTLIVTYQGTTQKEAAQKQWEEKRAGMPRPSVLLLVPSDRTGEYQTRFKKGSSSLNEDSASKQLNENIARAIYGNKLQYDVSDYFLKQLQDDLNHLRHQATRLEEKKEIELQQKNIASSENLRTYTLIGGSILALLILAALSHYLYRLKLKKSSFHFPDVSYKPRLGGEYSGGNDLLIGKKDFRR